MMRILVLGVIAVIAWKAVNIGATVLHALGTVLHLPTTTTIALAGFLTLLVAGLVVRSARLDAEIRASRRQAWRVRWRWHRLAPMLGLSVTDPPAGARSERRPRVLIPTLRVSADAYGLLVSARTLPRLGREEWQKVAPHLSNAWGCVRVAVTQEEPGRILIRAVRRDPLTEPASVVPSGEAPAQLDRWDIGRDEYAAPVSVRLANVPGLCISGLPGSGKTSVINGFIAQVAPSPAVQIAVIDGKGGADYEDLAGRFFAFVADDHSAAVDLLRQLVDLRRRRSERIRAVLGAKNFWHVGPSAAWPLVLLVVDEAHTFLCDGAVKGDKERTALALESRHLIEDLVKKGRSVGMLTILATQKMTGDAIPTAIRDVCPVAMSFAVRTDEAAVAALGADIRQYPEAHPVRLQGAAYVGVASMAVEGRPGFTRVRTPYVREEDVAAVCSATSGLTRDPLLLMGEAGGLPGSTATSDPGASRRGEDRSRDALPEGRGAVPPIPVVTGMIATVEPGRRAARTTAEHIAAVGLGPPRADVLDHGRPTVGTDLREHRPLELPGDAGAAGFMPPMFVRACREGGRPGVRGEGDLPPAAGGSARPGCTGQWSPVAERWTRGVVRTPFGVGTRRVSPCPIRAEPIQRNSRNDVSLPVVTGASETILCGLCDERFAPEGVAA